MLLWAPSRNRRFDEDEKGAKVEREQLNRTRKILAGMVFLSMSLVVASTMFTYGAQRRNMRRGVMEGSALRQLAKLPPNSMYHLSVGDQDGGEVSLMDYAGKLTLVVNTACK